jgi:general secretion pathway protein F
MPLYTYEAADRTGRKVRASMEAADEASVITSLQEKGLIPLAVKAARARTLFPAGRLTRKDLLTFTQEFGNLLEAGLPVDRALFVLSEHSEKESMRALLREIYVDIQRGQSLSQALGRHKVFPRLYVNMMRAGEVGGMLETVVKRLAGFIETTVAFQEEVFTAMIYPVLLSVVGMLSVVFIMLFVVPRFAELFQDVGQALPTPTLVLIALTDFVFAYWWLMLLGLAVLLLAARSYAATEEGRAFLDGLKLRIPVVKDIHMKLLIGRFSRTLGTLLESGVPILESIRVSREVLGNEVIEERLAGLEEGVQKGRGVSSPLRESGVFPPVVGQIISVGEEAGNLDRAFLTVADRFERESKSAISRTVSLIAPSIILFMSLIVGFIVISMLLAVFSINEIPI